MANKPFAIQGSDLTLGGVNLSAGTTGVVIPGVTQAVNFRVKEVDEMPNIGGQDLGSDETAVTVIDNAEYLYLVDDGDSPSADYVAATYSVDELDELGNIKEIDVETEGVFLTADKSRAEAANMWATLDPTPFVSFSAGNWTQIPFRPKMRAGEVENVGGGNADTGNFTFNEDTITNSDGMKLTTNRGTLAMGTNMETPGVAQHFHIAFDGSNSNPPASDLFLGDDNNYVKLPGYELNPTAQFGVEIGTDNRNLGPQNIEVGTVDELAPPGGVWRLFIDHDTYPNLGSAVSVGDTVTTSWGTPITATITAVIEESGNWWKIHVAQNITAGFSGGDTVSFGSPADSYTWRFGTDGVLTLPNAMTIDASVSFGIVTIGGSNTQIRIDDGGAPPGLYIRTDMAGADHGWRFGPDGDITFPDGTTQTTAYTGQNSGGNTIVRYVAVHSNGKVYGSSDGENWTPYTSIMDNIDKVAVGPTNIVYVADRTVGSGESLWYATAYNATPVEVAPSEGVVEYYNEVKYFSSIGKYIAVGHVEGGEGSDDVPLLLHSSDGVTWTRSYVDQGLLSESDPGDVEFTDIAENALGFFIVSDENQLGSFFLENITDALDATTLVDQADDYEHVIWVETAAAGFRGWHVFDDDQDWYYNANEDPRVGSFALFDFEDLDDIFEAALGYSDDPSEIVVGDYNGVSTIVIGTGDGQIMRWPATAATPTVVIPKPYTATISAWTSAVESVITYTGKEATSSNEKFTVSGSSVTAYNGTYYIDDNNNKVYTDLALTMPFDTTGLSAFTGTATITWSHGQYIDALHYSNGIFYVGNDSEEFFISTDGGATWTETDAFTDDNNPDSGYIDDIDSYSTATTTTNKLINGTQEFTLNANGSVTFPDGSIQTTAYTGGDLNTWVQTFESANPLQDIPLIALSVEYDSVGNVIALFYHRVEEGGSYYSVGKYTASGTRIWTTRFDTDYETDGWGLAVDLTSGFIYVAGKTNANGGQQKSTLTKIAGGGSVEWSNTYAFGVSINSNSQVVDVASDGNPVMVGYTVDSAGGGYVTTTKVDAEDGSIIWSKKLDGQADEEAYGMAIGPTGEVVAVGYMEQLGIFDAVATVVIEPTFDAAWANATTVSVGGFSCDITFASAGNPEISNIVDTVGDRTVGATLATVLGSVIGGTTDMVIKVATLAANNTDDHMLVVKYNSAGEIQWQKAILFDAGYDSTGADADIDSAGNVYVCGQYDANNFGIGVCMNLVKFNSAGVKQWSRRVEGDCGAIATSIVVGADDKLYLSGSLFTTTVPNPGPGDPVDISCVVAKYNLDGTVVWQRLLDNTDALSISGSDFLSSQGGGSNLAVKQDYVALAGGFGPDTNPDDFRALIAQLPAAGDLFAVGAWDFKASSLTGTLNTGASDITVVNADKTNTDNISNITVATVTPAVDSSAFLIGTLYSAPGSNNSLVNNGNQLILESTGALTLPQGGVISETEVNSSHSILLTPNAPSDANPDMAVKIYPTFNDDDHIHITAGNPSTVDLFLGDDDQYVKLEADGGNIVISADHPVGIKWTFGTDGNLTLPNLATISPVDVGYRFISSSNGPGGVAVQLNSLTVGIANTTLANAISADPGSFTIDFNGGLNDVVIAGISGPQGGTNIYTITGTWPANATGFPITITSDDYVAGGITKLDSANGVNIITTGGSWEFDTDGNLTLPYPGNPGSKIKGGPEGGINSIDLSWELILNSGKTIKINPGANGVVSPTFFAFNSDVVGGGITLPAGSSFDDRRGGVLISGAGQTAVNRFYTKVSNTLYQTVYGGVTYNLIDQAGIWSLDVVGENNPRYTSTDLITWTDAGGGLPAPTGQLSIRATELSVGTGNTWAFGGDGKLTVPGVITKDSALQLTSSGTTTTNGASVNVYGNLGRVLVRTDNGTSNKDWQFNVDGTTTFPNNTLQSRAGLTLTTGGEFNICTIQTAGSGYQNGNSTSYVTGGTGTDMVVGYGFGLSGQIVSVGVVTPGTGYTDGDVLTMTAGDGTATFVITRYNALANQANNNTIEFDWTFSTSGTLTFPNATVQTTAYPGVLVPANGDTVNGNANIVFYAGTDWYNTSKVTINPATSMLIINGNSGTGGITFPDATVQTTAATTYTLPTATTSVLGGVKVDGSTVTINNGVITAVLANAVQFKGGWNASTNTPTLSNSTGTVGWMYVVTTTGTQNLGNGSAVYSSTDFVIFDGTYWIPISSNAGIVSFNSRTGVVTLTSSDVTTALGFTPYNATNPTGYTTNTGTVTSTSIVSANGFTGTVATSTVTPAITISTSITGILKGDGTAISAATAGTDYQAPIGTISGLVKGNGANALTAATAGTDYISPYTSQTANYILAAPNGVAGTPVFRASVLADISNLGTGVATFLATPTSANLASAITDETGSAKVLFSTSPTVTTSLVTDSASFDLLNTTATTVNFAGAATTLNIGVSSGTTTIAGNLTVNGTTTTINSTTLTVDDKNIELGSIASPTNTTADGGGITLKGTTDKTFNWVNATSAWTSSEDLNLLTGKVYEINGVTVLTASAVLNDSTQTSVTVGGYATTLSIGATTGTASILNTSVNLGTSTGTLTTVTIGGAIAGNILKLAGTTTSTTTAITTDVTTGTVSIFDTGLTGILNIGSAVGQTNIATGTTASGSTKTVNIGTAGLSGSTNTITIGSTSAGGTMIFGQSTATSTYNIAAGATVSGSTKTIAIGTTGLSGSTTAISIGSAVSGATSTLTVSGSLADATATSTAKSVGYLGLPQSATATTATLAIGDAGKHIYVTTAGQTITIPANASVAYPIGTTITFIAGSSATTVLIAITTDTLRLAGGTSTGTRTLAANGMATAVKVAATTWYINGTGLT